MSPKHRLWQYPRLTAEALRRSWGNKANQYDTAQMTLDNEGELALVRSHCSERALRGADIRDVVTFGGAVGSRDPRVVCDALESRGIRLKEIYFNDLADEMVKRGLETHLSKYRESNTRVIALPGNVSDVVSMIPKRPRKVFIGVYHVKAFTRAKPEEGYPCCGLKEYFENQDRLGSQFVLQWCRIENGLSIPSGISLALDHDHAAHEEALRQAIELIVKDCSITEPGALRVVSIRGGQDEPFISHWYNEIGFRHLLEFGFGRGTRPIKIEHCAKGMVACIDPLEPPTGIVTVLNNVLGNMYPDDLPNNLVAMNEVSS